MINEKLMEAQQQNLPPHHKVEHSRVMSSLCGRVCGFEVAFVLV